MILSLQTVADIYAGITGLGMTLEKNIHTGPEDGTNPVESLKCILQKKGSKDSKCIIMNSFNNKL